MAISFKNVIGGRKVAILKSKLSEKYNLKEEEIYEIIADSILVQYKEGYIDYKRLYKDAFEKARIVLRKSKCKVINFPKEYPFIIRQDEMYERIIKRAFYKLYDNEQGIILEHIIKEEDDEFDIEEYNYVVQKLVSIIEEEDSELSNVVLNRLGIPVKRKKR